MSRPTDEEQEALYAQGEARIQELLQAAGQRSEDCGSDPILDALRSTEERNEGASVFAARGSIDYAAYFIGGKLTLPYLEFPSLGDRRIKFEGTAWGLGLGGFYLYGGGPFAHPDTCLGDASFEIHGAAVAGGTVQVTFWNSSGALGVTTAVGGGAGAAIMGGTGKFTAA